MAKVVGKVKKQKGKFYYVDKDGNVVEKSRSEMMKNKRKRKR
jgi:hypothetical protein